MNRYDQNYGILTYDIKSPDIKIKVYFTSIFMTFNIFPTFPAIVPDRLCCIKKASSVQGCVYGYIVLVDDGRLQGS